MLLKLLHVRSLCRLPKDLVAYSPNSRRVLEEVLATVIVLCPKEVVLHRAQQPKMSVRQEDPILIFYVWGRETASAAFASS